MPRNLPVPTIFYDVALDLPDVTPEEIRDAALAAIDATRTGDGATPEERKRIEETSRSLLRSIVAPYAESANVTVDLVCDALIAAAQSTLEYDTPKRGRRL